MPTLSERRWRALVLFLPFVLVAPLSAGVVIYDKDDKKVEVGGRIQLQYAYFDPSSGDGQDEILFRRLRPYVAGTVTPDWWGKLQVDFGKAIDGGEVAVKDAFLQYQGWKNLTLTIGNAKTPFSREYLASSKRQQTVERGFVGDHNFGSPDRQLGLRLDGKTGGGKITWAAALGGEQHDPDARRIDFDSPANNQSDWNEGVIAAARVDFHPRGIVKFDQGDFHSADYKFNFSLAAFSWSNDGDNNSYTDRATGRSTSSSKADLDEAVGFELSAGLRGRGISIDVEFDTIAADLVDPRFTGGAYRNGATDLDKMQVEGGYMLRSMPVELVAAWESLDADNYETAWTAAELGVNYFWNRHKVKVQLNWRRGENVFGVRGDDADTILLQMQFVF